VKRSRWTKKIHVWGGIGYFYKTPLYFVENLNAALYQSILETTLKPEFAPDCPSHRKKKWFLIQDNARFHKTPDSLRTIQGIVGDRMYELPALSPDFNIVEDCWSYMDRIVRTAKITTLKGLKRRLTKIWKDLPWDYVRQSVDSIPDRLNECISLAERTHY